jgi:hypothetical protein
MILRTVALILSIAALAACSNAAFGPAAQATASVALGQPAALQPAKEQHHSVYWTLFGSCSYPQVQSAKVPLKATSKHTSYYCSKGNGLHYTSGLAVQSGRLWVISFSTSGGQPSEVAVFKLPLKATSVQQYTFVLSGTNAADALAFDPSGNLWVTSPGNGSVLQYTGPFKKSGTLSPAITLTESGDNFYGIAVDKSAHVYVSINNSKGTDSIGVLKPPYKGKPYFLNGLTAPGGLAFDKQGDLYASTNASSTQGVVRYDSNDLKSGDTPSIVDSTGIPSGSYEAAFAFTAGGDLYAANCGPPGAAGIDVWPLSKKRFSSSLAPSVRYTNSDITQAGCAWGIAIK